jgi:hypothetical protein
MAVRSPFFTRTPHAASLPRRGARSCTVLFVYEILSNNALPPPPFFAKAVTKLLLLSFPAKYFRDFFSSFFDGKR